MYLSYPNTTPAIIIAPTNINGTSLSKVAVDEFGHWFAVQFLLEKFSVYTASQIEGINAIAITIAITNVIMDFIPTIVNPCLKVNP